MERPIQSVEMVSDGILVRFSDGLLTYYPHSFLRDHSGCGPNQIFLEANSDAMSYSALMGAESAQRLN